jgi:hypothetical protein
MWIGSNAGAMCPLIRKNAPPQNPVEIRGGLAHLTWCARPVRGA